jgi:hypothetical protein
MVSRNNSLVGLFHEYAAQGVLSRASQLSRHCMRLLLISAGPMLLHSTCSYAIGSNHFNATLSDASFKKSTGPRSSRRLQELGYLLTPKR